MAENNLETITSWAKRRGFIFPGSEIYGGVGGIYDLGPYGTALKNNIKKLWWKTFVESRDDVVGIDTAILMNRKVWQASGHEKGFVDFMVECSNCKKRYRWPDDFPDVKVIMHEVSEPAKEKVSTGVTAEPVNVKCSNCGEIIDTNPRAFNGMFKTFVGATADESSSTYLRPETAQGMFVNFKHIQEISRKKIPFGIAQFGKSFRNEITARDFIYRVREFEIGEIEYFVKPGEDEKIFEEWLKVWKKFAIDLGIQEENLIEYEHPKESLSHYSKRTIDFNYRYPFGTKELIGVANRTDYDLKQHMDASGKDLNYFDPETGKKYLPYVIEPTCSLERLMLAIICEAYEEVGGGRGETLENPSTSAQDVTDAAETVLHFKPSIAPVKIAVLPLVKKLSDESRKIYQDLKTCYPDIEFDESGSIGRRYRRQDEIGTPYCVTIDFDTLDDKKVTVRDRDSMKQERIAISELKNYFFDKIVV